MKSTIRLTDDTVGTIKTKTVAELFALTGKYVVVDLFDENGMPMQVPGIMAEVLD